MPLRQIRPKLCDNWIGYSKLRKGKTGDRELRDAEYAAAELGDADNASAELPGT